MHASRPRSLSVTRLRLSAPRLHLTRKSCTFRDFLFRAHLQRTLQPTRPQRTIVSGGITALRGIDLDAHGKKKTRAYTYAYW